LALTLPGMTFAFIELFYIFYRYIRINFLENYLVCCVCREPAEALSVQGAVHLKAAPNKIS